MKSTVRSLVLFFAGVGIGVYLIGPQLSGYQEKIIKRYFTIRDLKKSGETFSPESFKNQIAPRYYQLDPKYKNRDVESLISVSTEEMIFQKRRELVQVIWGREEKLDQFLPQKVVSNISEPLYANITNLSHIDRLTDTMDQGLESVILWFAPQNKKNSLIIYHEGHHPDSFKTRELIGFFVFHGYQVALIHLPLTGPNNKPEVPLEKIGKFQLELHDHMKFLDHPLRFFMEPLAAVVNYSLKKYPDLSIAVVGSEGGGWAATLYSAIDPRIQNSYPLSGSYPLYLRSGADYDWGDFEQTYPPLVQTIDYLDLYILGAYGPERSQLQIISRYNECCFGGVKYKTYEDKLKEKIKALRYGSFEIWVDESSIDVTPSPASLEKILADLEKK